MSKQWSIYIPGPDEYHAAPSEAAAKHMAKRHNDAMKDYCAKNKLDWGLDMITAEVAEWPFEAEGHTEELKDFDYAGWGLEGGAA